MSDRLEFVYQPKRIALFFITLILGMATLWMAHVAYTNDRGLVLNHIIPFSVNGATVFYWVIAALCLGFTLWLFAAFLSAVIFGKRVFLQLGETELHATNSMIRTELRTTPYSEITGLGIQELKGKQSLIIRHLSGKITLNCSQFKDKEEFIKVCQFIAAKSQIGKAS